MNKNLNSWLTVIKHKNELNQSFTEKMRKTLSVKFSREKEASKRTKETEEIHQFNAMKK